MRKRWSTLFSLNHITGHEGAFQAQLKLGVAAAISTHLKPSLLRISAVDVSIAVAVADDCACFPARVLF
jgi:hypothetical protein